LIQSTSGATAIRMGSSAATPIKQRPNTRRPKAANGISPATSSTRRESFGSGAAQMAVQSVVKTRRRIVSMSCVCSPRCTVTCPLMTPPRISDKNSSSVTLL
jgi:hypothetical protein